MKKNVFVFIIVIILTLLSFSGAYALTTIKSERGIGRVVIESDQIIDDNVATAANTVIVRGTINDSLFVAANSIRIEGTVQGNLIAAGNSIIITGSVQQDVIAAGNVVQLESDGQVGRDFVSTSNATTINGSVTRNVRNASGDLTINGTVNGDVTTASGTIALGSDASVAGNMEYYSETELDIPGAEQVEGEIVFRETRETPVRPGFPRALILFGFLMILHAVVLGIVIALLAPRWLALTNTVLFDNALKAFGYGILLLVAIPIIAVILMATIIALPIAFVLLLIYSLALIFSQFIVAYYIGTLIRKQRVWSPVLTMLLGVIILEFIFLIPLLGFLARIIVASLGLGAIFLINPLKTASETGKEREHREKTQEETNEVIQKEKDPEKPE
jgi:cytoskeletal protein CcmA (bactofilin family)